mmetsp:Transcript_84858/g.205755  ORF Transcript_84858/g.205755 Transcript_84858/m.205755 type:complete len:283 (+) Transcript_84858:83-931(+)
MEPLIGRNVNHVIVSRQIQYIVVTVPEEQLHIYGHCDMAAPVADVADGNKVLDLKCALLSLLDLKVSYAVWEQANAELNAAVKAAQDQAALSFRDGVELQAAVKATQDKADTSSRDCNERCVQIDRDLKDLADCLSESFDELELRISCLHTARREPEPAGAGVGPAGGRPASGGEHTGEVPSETVTDATHAGQEPPEAWQHHDQKAVNTCLCTSSHQLHRICADHGHDVVTCSIHVSCYSNVRSCHAKPAESMSAHFVRCHGFSPLQVNVPAMSSHWVVDRT